MSGVERAPVNSSSAWGSTSTSSTWVTSTWIWRGTRPSLRKQAAPSWPSPALHTGTACESRERCAHPAPPPTRRARRTRPPRRHAPRRCDEARQHPRRRNDPHRHRRAGPGGRLVHRPRRHRRTDPLRHRRRLPLTPVARHLRRAGDPTPTHPPVSAPDQRKVERFHRTAADGWAYAGCYTSETERRGELDGWLHC